MVQTKKIIHGVTCVHRSARRTVNRRGWVQMSMVDPKGTGGHKNEVRGGADGRAGT